MEQTNIILDIMCYAIQIFILLMVFNMRRKITYIKKRLAEAERLVAIAISDINIMRGPVPVANGGTGRTSVDAFKSLDEELKKDSDEQFLTREQAAQYLGVKPGTLSLWAHHNKNNTGKKNHQLEFHKVKGKVLYKKSDVERVYKERKK